MVKNSASRKPSGLHMESLEARELMAADLFVASSGGHLLVSERDLESNTNSSVQVSHISGDQYLVEGFNGTTINGKASGVFHCSGNLNVSLGAGNDTLRLNGGVYQQAFIRMHDPVAGSADTDYVFVNGVRTNGVMDIVTGAGNDTVDVAFSSIGVPWNQSLLVRTGAGNDTLRVTSSSVGHLVAYTYDNFFENYTDQVALRNVGAGGNVNINTGAGADTVDAYQVSSRSDINIFTQGGADTVKLRDVQALDDVYVDLGDGNDTLDLTYCRADEMTLIGGGGYDTMTRYLDGPVRTQTVTGFETPFTRSLTTCKPVTAARSTF